MYTKKIILKNKHYRRSFTYQIAGYCCHYQLVQRKATYSKRQSPFLWCWTCSSRRPCSSASQHQWKKPAALPSSLGSLLLLYKAAQVGPGHLKKKQKKKKQKSINNLRKHKILTLNLVDRPHVQMHSFETSIKARKHPGVTYTPPSGGKPAESSCPGCPSVPPAWPGLFSSAPVETDTRYTQTLIKENLLLKSSCHLGL